MKPIHVASTIVRLFSICLAIYALTLFFNAWIFFISSDDPIFSILTVSFPVALLILSLTLWHFPISISRKITGLPSTSDSQDLSFKSDEFFSICMFALGIYFLYGIVGEVVYWANYSNYLIFEEISTDVLASLSSLGVRLVFAICLLIGNKKLTLFFHRLRHGG